MHRKKKQKIKGDGRREQKIRSKMCWFLTPLFAGLFEEQSNNNISVLLHFVVYSSRIVFGQQFLACRQRV